jgi:hypothetical protein
LGTFGGVAPVNDMLVGGVGLGGVTVNALWAIWLSSLG